MTTQTLLLLCCCLSLQTVFCKKPIAHDDLTRALLDWLSDNGAVISNKIEIRPVDPNDATSIRGVFATETIQEDELICSIPWNLAIKPENPNKSDFICDTVEATTKAMKQDKDKITPYAKYLLAQPRNYVPGFWSQQGKDFLKKMKDRLPPYFIEDVLTESWADICKGANMHDELQRHAAMLVTARADHDIMVPFYDMINHRNGKWCNVCHRARDYYDLMKQSSFDVVASKTIHRGEQLYVSYNQCNICETVSDSTGTPEIFKNFGFVEFMPQRWMFVEPRIKFDLDYNSSTDLDVMFFVPPSQEGIDFMRQQLKRLGLFEKENNDKENTSIPKSEWDTIWDYYNALTVAIKAVLESNVELSDEVWDMGRDWWKPEGSLDLNEEYHWIDEYYEDEL